MGSLSLVTFLLVSCIVAGVLFVPGCNAVVYTRWGRNDCPGSKLVYKGYAAGGRYTHTGSGSNYVCLTDTPTWGAVDPSDNNLGRIYGTEYGYVLLSTSYLVNSDVPCAVCQSKADEKLMIPGTNVCPFGWNVEYGGYLVSGHYSQTAQVDYVCMDGDPSVAAFNDPLDNGGAYFYPVEAECGALPCGPYVQDWELTCVVCTL